MSDDDENPLETVFTYLLFAALFISPVIIMQSFNSYESAKLMTKEMNAYIDTVNTEGITNENLTAFLDTMADFGAGAEITLYTGGEYVTWGEIRDLVDADGRIDIKYGSLLEVTATGDHKVYAQRILGQN